MVADFTNNLTVNCDGAETMVGGVVHIDGGDYSHLDSNNIMNPGKVFDLN